MRQLTSRLFAREGIEFVLALALDPFLDERWRNSADASTRALKIVVSLTTMFAAAVAIASLWTHAFVLALVLTSLGFLKHKMFPIKYELAWFVLDRKSVV